jgi:acetylornithine deacetylase/succinyl-diaminopimelate desuccinylase-like protein
MPVFPRQVIELLSPMIRIESVTPCLVEGGSGEAKIAEFIAGWLLDSVAGVDVELVEVKPGRPNVIARLRGTGGGPTLCLHAHTDTVGYEGWPDEALMPKVDGDRIYGLGATDDKAGCAAAMLALRSLAESRTRSRGDLLAAFVADGEGASIGSEQLVRQGGFDAAIVLEPGRTHEIGVEHQGFGWLDIITRGVAAHGRDHESGVDAIVHLAEVISRLHQLDLTKFQAYPSLLNGKTVFHTGTITGGTDYSTYPNFARVGVKVGTQPGEHLSDRIAEIHAIFAEIARIEPGFSGEIVVKLEHEPFVASGHEELQQMAAGAMMEVLGRKAKISGMDGWTDAPLIQASGVPTLLLGSAGGNYHVPNEWASISEVIKLSAVLERIARQYLALSAPLLLAN